MKIFIVMCLLVISFSDSVYNLTVNELLSQVPNWMNAFTNNMKHDYLDPISNHWNEMVKAIQKPVRIRRLGSIGKRKLKRTRGTSPTPILDTQTIIETTEVLPFTAKIFSSPDMVASIDMPPDFKRITIPEDVFPMTDLRDEKVEVPYIQNPVWTSLEEWKQMQRPNFVKIFRESLKRRRAKSPMPIFNTPTTEDTTSQVLPIFPPTTERDATSQLPPFTDYIFTSPDKAVSVEKPIEFKKILEDSFVILKDCLSEPVMDSADEKLELPYITKPAWRAMVNWTNYRKVYKDFKAVIPVTESNLAGESDENKFGVLFFI